MVLPQPDVARGDVGKGGIRAVGRIGPEGRPIPVELDYDAIPGLPRESKDRLKEVRPVNFGQASRVSGVRPADIAVLHIYVAKLCRL